MLHTNSFFYHPQSINFFSQHFSFPCQYHYTNAPYSFIHLPTTLYWIIYQHFSFFCHYHLSTAPYAFIYLTSKLYYIFFPVFQFPLLVSFQQCPKPIHSPATHTVLSFFFSQYFCFLVSFITAVFHNHSLIGHPRGIIFFSVVQFSLSVSYHQCPILIHLPPTLNNIFLPALQFPLSVSFQQCPTLTHLSTTDALYYFSPSTSDSPVTIIPPILHTHSFIYHRRCIMIISQYFSFPCQYDSIKSP